VSLEELLRDDDQTPQNGETKEPEDAQEPAEDQAQDTGGQPTESGDEGCQSEECQTALINFIKQEFGEDLSHYKNDVEAIKGLLNAKKLVGKRESDARVMQILRAQYGDDFIEQLLAGNPPEQVMSKKKSEPSPSDDELEWDDSWLAMVTRNENGELVPLPGAPKDIPDKILRFLRHRESTVNAFAKNPRKFIESVVSDAIISKVDQLIDAKLNQTVSAAAEQAAVSEWAAANRALLFKEGDPNGELTPLAEEVIARADQLMADGITSPSRALMRAWESVSSRLEKPKSPLPPPPGSMHAPQKAGSKKKQTLEDLIDKGYSLSEAYRMLKDME